MAINRYDSPAQDQYRNTYVPLPYEQIMGTVAARQAQLQREQDMLAKTYEDTQNLKYIPGTKDEAYVRDYLSKAGDLVNKYYGQDLSDPIVKNQLRQQFAAMTDKQTIQNIQTSHDAWATNQKFKAQLKAEGLYDPAIDEDPANRDWSTVSAGKTYDYISPSYKNPRPAAESYFNNLKASDLGPSGDYNYSGVTSDKINSVASQKWGEFVNTSEGNMYVKKIAKERGLDYTDPKVRQQIGTEYLKGVGEEFIYRDQGTPTLEAQTRAAMSKKGVPPGGDYLNTTQEQTIRSKDSFDPYGIGKIDFDKDGKVIVNTASKEHMMVVPGLGPGKPSGEYIDQVKQKQVTDELQKKLDIIRTNLPQLKGLGDKETYQAYRDLTKDGKAFPDLPKIDLPSVPKDGLANYLSDSMLDRELMVRDDFGSSDLRAATDNSDNSPLRDLGYTTQSLKTELKLAAAGSPKATISIGGIAQNGPEAGMLELEVLDMSGKGGNKGKVRKLYISTNEEMKSIMSPSNDVYNNIRSMKGGVSAIGTNSSGRTIGVKVTPNVVQDPNTHKWVYDYQLNEGFINPDNSFEPGSPVTMADIRKLTMNRLTNSQFINSELNFTKKTEPSF